MKLVSQDIITAKQAAALSEEINAIDSNTMVNVGSEIREAAKAGRRAVVCCVDKTWSTEPTMQFNITPNVIQAKIMNKLTDLGYTVKLARHGAEYVPRGLQDDDGRGPKHINWHIHIYW